MSRTLPMECEHGVIVDWGDFGPCQDCDEHDGEDCPNLPDCERCEAERARCIRVQRDEYLTAVALADVFTGRRAASIVERDALADKWRALRSAGEVRAGTCVPALPTPAHEGGEQ